MLTLRTVDEMTRWAEARRTEGLCVGLVPTMGSLHRGHLSLMHALRPQVDVLICSIFVNPLQFGQEEDLDAYPRDAQGDADRCEEAGVDVVFSFETMYPKGYDMMVIVGAFVVRWEGVARPTHFEGVATVVARLFGITRCDVAAFGEKDYQQLAVIRRMVHDLALPVRVVGCPLIRDEDGLALSSRNVYLTPGQRLRARTLSQALFAMQRDVAEGTRDVATLERRAAERVDSDQLEYLAVVDVETLEPVARVNETCRVVAVAQYGSTRLLDNVEVG
jgi:pantoate--beta-alanine ligase